jgi:hypothetical protein
MATIQEYTAPNAMSTIRPSETGEQATARAAAMGERRAAVVGDMYARSIGTVGRSIEQSSNSLGKIIDEHMFQSEASKQTASGISLANSLTDQFNQLEKDPATINNPQVLQKFYEEKAMPAIQQWQDGFHTERGQNLGRETAARYMEHFQDLASVGIGHVARAASLVNLKTTADQASDMVGKDPGSLGLAGDIIDGAFNTIVNNPSLKADDKFALQEQLSTIKGRVGESAFYGRMATNPAQALKDLNSGVFDNWHLDKGKLIEQATSASRNRTNQSYIDQEHARILGDQRDQTALFRDGFTTGPDGALTPVPGYLNKLIASSAQPGGPSAETLRFANELTERAMNPREMKSAPGQYSDHLNKLLDGTESTEDVIRATGQPGGLSPTDGMRILQFNSSVDRAEKPLVSQFMNEAKHQFATPNIAMGGSDPIGQHYMTQFMIWAQPKIDAAVKNGTIRDVLDQNSPNYIMKGVNWDQFKTTSQASLITGARPDLARAAIAVPSFADRIRMFGEHGHPNDVSPAGAVGSMQVMPGTLTDPGLGVKPFDPKDPNDSTERVGRDYANALLQRYGGNEILASVAYNAGIGMVDKFMSDAGIHNPTSDGAVFGPNGKMSNGLLLQMIPHSDYAKRVLDGRGQSSPENAAAIMWGK